MIYRLLGTLVVIVLVGLGLVISLMPPKTRPELHILTVAALPSPYVKAQIDPDAHGSAVGIGNGYYVTAGHVAIVPKITLIRDDGAEKAADVLWTNANYDIALLHMDDTMFTGSVVLDCSKPEVGEHITAHGNPLVFDKIDMQGRIAGDVRQIDHWVAGVPVDMTVLPGMSGGGVTDDAGKLVGITVGVMGIGPSMTGLGVIVPSEAVCLAMGRQ